jgi:hypothetical protein
MQHLQILFSVITIDSRVPLGSAIRRAIHGTKRDGGVEIGEVAADLFVSRS